MIFFHGKEVHYILSLTAGLLYFQIRYAFFLASHPCARASPPNVIAGLETRLPMLFGTSGPHRIFAETTQLTFRGHTTCQWDWLVEIV